MERQNYNTASAPLSLGKSSEPRKTKVLERFANRPDADGKKDERSRGGRNFNGERGSFGGKRSFGDRNDRKFGERNDRRSGDFGDRRREDGEGGERREGRFNRSDRPFNRDDRRAGGFSDRRRDGKPFGDRRRDERNGEGAERSERPFNRDDRRAGGFSDRRRDGKPFGDRRRDDRNGEGGFKGERSERRFDRKDRFERSERGDRFDRGDRFERGERFDRKDRSFSKSREERGDRNERRFERAERAERGERFDRRGGDRKFGGRRDRNDRGERNFEKPRENAVWRDGERQEIDRKVTDVRSVFESSVPLGRMIELPVSDITEQGAFVNAQEFGALFVPRSQLPEGLEIGQNLRVFLYKDGERVLATARHPYIELGMTGRLRVNMVENGTAYLDLGIPKELVVPVSEQRTRRGFYEGDDALVLVAIDELGRLFGTQCFNRYIREKADPDEFEINQKVSVVAVATTPLGFRVIVADKVYGLIYQSEQKGELVLGKRYEGYIKLIREDGRLDVSLQEGGREGIEHAALDLLQALNLSDGHLDFNDKSDPQLIEDYLHMSKGRFKKAVGSLYKERFIELVDNGINLTDLGREHIEARRPQKGVKAEISQEEMEQTTGQQQDENESSEN